MKRLFIFLALLLVLLSLAWIANLSSPLSRTGTHDPSLPQVGTTDETDGIIATPLNWTSVPDPFSPPQQSKPRSTTSASPTAPSVPPPPLPYKLDAILPGAKPLAILRRGGETVIAGPGQSAWDATVTAVSADSVWLSYKDHAYALPRP